MEDGAETSAIIQIHNARYTTLEMGIFVSTLTRQSPSLDSSLCAS